MNDDKYMNSEDRVEQKVRSNPNHTEGQNSSLLEVVDRLATAHLVLAEAFIPFITQDGKIATIAAYIHSRQLHLVSEFTQISRSPKEFHAEGFIQYDHPNHPEAIAKAFVLSPELPVDDLQSAILSAREALIQWTRGLSQEDIPERMRDFLTDLIRLQEREKHTLAAGFDSHNKS